MPYPPKFGFIKRIAWGNVIGSLRLCLMKEMAGLLISWRVFGVKVKGGREYVNFGYRWDE